VTGAGLALPPAGGGVSVQTVAFAAGLTGRSGKAPVIEAALAHRTGRPRPLPVRAVLTALVCLALDDRPLFLTDATRLLFCQLPKASRRLLGVPGTATSQRAFLAAYRRVRYCFGAICPVMDPSALPKNRRLTQDDLKARTRPMTPARAEAARSRLDAFINALPEASISVLTSEERAAYDGCTGLDATPVPLFSRGPSRRAGLCASDPDGGWYVREGITASVRTTRAGRCGRSPGRWRPPSPPRHGRRARRPRTPIWPPAWRWPGPVCHLAEHHRRPQRLRQRPRPPGPRPARPAPRPRHRRLLPVHRAAADRRQHPQDPRLAGSHHRDKTRIARRARRRRTSLRDYLPDG
jgi:hypothetical protein